MNFRLFTKTFIYSLAVLCAVSILIFSTVKEKQIPEQTKNAPDSAQDTSKEMIIPQSTALSHYILKLEDNTINIYEVYSNQTKTKCGTLDIPTDTLREIDRINFEHGIIAKDADDILHLTEDFTS